jgi:hypothetical protein
MPVKLWRFAAVALAVALAAAVGGCGSGGPANDGPLNSGGGSHPARGTECAPARLGQATTFGVERFTNHGPVAVVLDRVVLQHPYHERLAGSYAVPGIWLIGVVPWPPRYPGIPATWKERRPVHGFRVAPGKSFNMVLGVTATATGLAISRGMLVYYHDPAGNYVTRDDVGMQIAVNKSQCDP